MTKTRQIEGALLLATVVWAVGCGGGGDDGKGSGGSGSMAKNDPSGQPATETNAAPVPCGDDSACPPGIACVFPTPGETGYCDVAEMGAAGTAAAADMPVSSAAPALCMTDEDCGPGIVCKHFEGDSGPGGCDVQEMVVPGDGAAGSSG